MSRPRKPISIDEAIERIEAKAVEAAANSKLTGKATSALLNLGHYLYTLQMIKALSSTDPVSGQTLSAAARFLAANGVRREPSYEDYDEDGTSDGLEDIVFPFLEDGSPNPDYDPNDNPLAKR